MIRFRLSIYVKEKFSKRYTLCISLGFGYHFADLLLVWPFYIIYNENLWVVWDSGINTGLDKRWMEKTLNDFCWWNCSIVGQPDQMTVIIVYDDHPLFEPFHWLSMHSTANFTFVTYPGSIEMWICVILFQLTIRVERKWRKTKLCNFVLCFNDYGFWNFKSLF